MSFWNFLTEEQQQWKDTCHRVMDKEITREYIRECDMNREYYYEGFDKLHEQGMMTMLIPEELGGMGADAMSYAIFNEAMGKYGVDFVATLGVSQFTAQNLVKYGTPEQQEKFLRPFIDGTGRFAVSISEPHAGSDAAAATTRAVKEGDHYSVTGLKQWCSGSSAKNCIICMLVRTDPDAPKREGLSILIIPNDTPNMELRKLKTLARRGTGTNQIFLDGAKIPVENRLGKEGQGWKIITGHLELERVAVAAGYVGCAQQAVDDALAYAHQREAFGQPIFKFQTLRHMLADMQTEVDAARLLTYRAAAMMNAGQNALREVSMAKLHASETLQKVSRQGIQIMGGHGMLPEADMERYFREGMQATIGGGTSEIQRTLIAQTMRL
ncbi:MAG: acyl-CoA dehydrogenase family protein [Gammaproteobacteria bacterium]|nr:acyl-CoA dehydrogenase family protein [Gammaproteobacteria bacterium]